MAKQQKTERIYVKVDSTFDSTGYMLPTSITWADGRTVAAELICQKIDGLICHGQPN